MSSHDPLVRALDEAIAAAIENPNEMTAKAAYDAADAIFRKPDGGDWYHRTDPQSYDFYGAIRKFVREPSPENALVVKATFEGLFQGENGAIPLNPANLRDKRAYFYPGGSGPLSMMGWIVRFIDAVAEDKGWEVGQTKTPYPPVPKKKRRKRRAENEARTS